MRTKKLFSRAVIGSAMLLVAMAGGCVSQLGEQLPPNLKKSEVGKIPVNLGTETQYAVTADQNGENVQLAGPISVKNHPNAWVFNQTATPFTNMFRFNGQLWPVQVNADIDQHISGGLNNTNNNYDYVDFYPHRRQNP